MQNKTGVELIIAERTEQIEKHGRTIELDVEQNNEEQLAQAAAFMCYPPDGVADPIEILEVIPANWNYEIFKKMMGKPYKERLIIAGALIAAEIDRIQAEETHGG